jgi:hypothetical protein
LDNVDFAAADNSAEATAADNGAEAAADNSAEATADNGAEAAAALGDNEEIVAAADDEESGHTFVGQEKSELHQERVAERRDSEATGSTSVKQTPSNSVERLGP